MVAWDGRKLRNAECECISRRSSFRGTRGPGSWDVASPAVIRIVLVEDHPTLRLGLRAVLEHEGMEVCGEASSIEEALRCIAQARPDLVTLDLTLGAEDGLDLVRHPLLADYAKRWLVYSGFEDATHIERSLTAGAAGYITKGEANTVLGNAVRECVAGRRFLSPKAVRVLKESPFVRELLAVLSGKEQDVYIFLGHGVAIGEIASRLDLSPRTVESYCARIQIKLGLAGMKELRDHALAKPIN